MDDKELSTIAHQLRPYVARMRTAPAGGSVGSGAAAVALIAAHVAEVDPHTGYRLESVDIPLDTDVTGTLPPPNGGTGIPSYTAGDILYATNATTLAKRAIGTANQFLTVDTGLPVWTTFSDTLHGNRGGGSLHDVAVAGVSAGFMSAADKTILDALAGASFVDGAGTANRIPIWSDPNTLGDSAKLYVATSPRGGAYLTFINEGEALFGGGSSLTSLYTNFHTDVKAVVEIKTESPVGAGSNSPVLVLSADHSGYVGPDAVTGAVVFADRTRTTRLDAASLTVVKDAVYGARMMLKIADSSSTAPESALEILATKAVWIGYSIDGSSSAGTLVGAGDLDVKNDFRVGDAATIAGSGTALTVDNNARVSGYLGVGTAPSADHRLVVYDSGTPLPSFSLHDGDITLPNYGASGLNPLPSTNEIGRITSASSGDGGTQLLGFTDTSAGGTALVVTGVLGSNSPTGIGVMLRAIKSDGVAAPNGGLAALGNSEIVVQVRNFSSTIMNILGDGSVGITVTPVTRLDIGAGAMRYAEMTAPSAPAANSVVVFSRDDGAGVTELCARFNTGDIIPIARQGVTIQTYTITNVTTDRSFDADTVAVTELADAFGTLIADLRAQGIVK